MFTACVGPSRQSSTNEYGKPRLRFTESAVNQVISKRMVKNRTPRSAHLLPEVRTRVVSDSSPATFAAGTRTLDPIPLAA